MKKLLSKVALAALATAAGATAAHAQSAPAPTHSTSWTGTVGEDRFGEARFKMRGRFQYDIISNDLDFPAGITDEDGTRSYVRRAFLGVQGRLSERWRYKVDFILSPGDDAAGQVGVDDAFLEYVADDWSFVIGEHNITSPLEDRISSLDIPFIERTSVINAFEYGRRAGLGAIWSGANYSLAGAIQGDSLNNADTNYALDESTAISGRFTWAPIFETSPEGVTLIHLGLVARQRDIGEDAVVRYRTRPLNGRGARGIDAGAGVNGESDTTFGVELALQRGPFGVQAEYHTLEGDTVGGVGYEYNGYYVDAYWSITGESRSYRGNTGSFGAIAPARAINNGGPGHLMLSARYDFIDLSDPASGLAAATRGEQTAYAVGLDWVPLDHVRFKLNYAQTDMDRATGPDGDGHVISLRTQFDF